MTAAAATGVAGSVACEALDWPAADAWLAARAAAGLPRRFDWVFGSDIVYHQQHDFAPVRALAALLSRLLLDNAGGEAAGAKPTRCLFGYQERDAAARLAFWAALAEHGLGVTERTLEQLGAEEGLDIAGLSGPMVLWWIARAEAAPAGGAEPESS